MLQSMMLQRVGHDLATEQQHEVLPNMYYSHEASLTAQVLSPLPFLGFHEHFCTLSYICTLSSMTNRDSILKSRDITLLSSKGYGFSSSHVWMRELDYKES